MTLAKICVLIIEALAIGLIAARLNSSRAPAIRMLGLAILSFIIGYLAFNGTEKLGNELLSQGAALSGERPASPPK